MCPPRAKHSQLSKLDCFKKAHQSAHLGPNTPNFLNYIVLKKPTNVPTKGQALPAL